MYCVKKAVLQKNMPEVYQAVGTEDFLIEENRMMKKYLEKENERKKKIEMKASAEKKKEEQQTN